MSKFFIVSWGVICAVTAFDIWWAGANMESFAQWEPNPVAVMVYRRWGFGAVALGRSLSVCFALLVVSVASKRARVSGTAVVLAMHLWMAAEYAVQFSE